MSKIHSFPPIAPSDATMLILGSMPGAMSLAASEYYAHPRNTFWDIMGELFGARRELSYAERVRVLLRQRVGVWDVLQQCERAGSLDSAITHERANDFNVFFAQHARIQTVCFNGGKAQAAFRKHVLPQLPAGFALRYRRLPSTSPAHAGMRYADKLRAWRAVLQMQEAHER